MTNYINKHFGKIKNLEERKNIITELKNNNYEIKFNAIAARNRNENVTVFYNKLNYKYMLLFDDSFTDFYCESYLIENSKIVL